MSETLTLIDRYYRTRSRYWRMKRIWFPSPAEMRFIELLGGHILRPSLFGWRHVNENGFPLCIVISRGKILRQAKMRREVRYGRYYVDFSNDLHRIIEIDGADFHRDVVADMAREIDIKGRQTEARFLRIQAHQIYKTPALVRARVEDFLF